MSESRVVDAVESPAEQIVEASVRPRTLAEYVGQAAMREQLSLSIEAAKKRGDDSSKYPTTSLVYAEAAQIT